MGEKIEKEHETVENKTSDEIKQMIQRFEQDPALAFATTRQMNQFEMIKTSNDLFYEIKYKESTLQTLQDTMVGADKVIKRAQSYIDRYNSLQGEFVVAKDKATKEADYTSILAHMLLRDKLSRKAKQRPYEEILEEHNFLVAQLEFIYEHKRQNKDDTKTLNIKLAQK